MTLKHTNYPMQRKPNEFELKHGNQKHNEKTEWINNITRELERPESRNTHQFTQNDTKKYQTGKRQAMMEYMVSS